MKSIFPNLSRIVFLTLSLLIFVGQARVHAAVSNPNDLTDPKEVRVNVIESKYGANQPHVEGLKYGTKCALVTSAASYPFIWTNVALATLASPGSALLAAQFTAIPALLAFGIGYWKGKSDCAYDSANGRANHYLANIEYKSFLKNYGSYLQLNAVQAKKVFQDSRVILTQSDFEKVLAQIASGEVPSMECTTTNTESNTDRRDELDVRVM